MTRKTLTTLAIAASVAAVLVVAEPGYDAARVRMHSGALWLASVHTGQATLVDGPTAEVKARVPVAEPDTALSVVQQGDAAYALNQRTGQLSRIDTAAEKVSRPVSLLPPSDGLVVKAGPDALHVIDVHSGAIVSAVRKPWHGGENPSGWRRGSGRATSSRTSGAGCGRSTTRPVTWCRWPGTNDGRAPAPAGTLAWRSPRTSRR